MMNEQEVIKKVLAEYPDRSVEEVYENKGLYLVIAPHKGMFMDESDPFFLVNSETGGMTPFIPSESFELYRTMMDPKKRFYSKR